ncbi:transcriptional regulator SplA domain-containing protein [Virgibacillus ainsalahensis]
MEVNQTFKPGEVVYIIIRNPHAQDVANVQQAAVVENPDKPNELALFLHETYFPLTDEFAVFKTETEAEQVFYDAFGSSEEGSFYG